MDLDSLTPDAIIERFSLRPAYLLKSRVSVQDPVRFTVLPQSLASLSIGTLGAFPIELLHNVCNLLDFQSLSRLKQVSHGGKNMVESLPSYQRLIKYASPALIVLSRMDLIRVHTAATIYAAFRSDKCVSCDEFAVFLFLLTCERCCNGCLRKTRSLQVIERSAAGSCFALSHDDLNQLPSMRMSLGSKFLEEDSVGLEDLDQPQLPEPLRYVSLKEAYVSSASIFGFKEALQRVLSSGPPRNSSDLCKLHLTEQSTGTESTSRPNDIFCGLASIHFPCLRPDGELEDGLWCNGCRKMTKIRPQKRLSSELRRRLEMNDQERSRSGFLAHVRDCEDVKRLVQEPVVRSRTAPPPPQTPTAPL